MALRPLRSRRRSYKNLEDGAGEQDTPWFWRLISLAAAIMVLGGYLILTAAYDSDPQLRFSQSVLFVFVVALLAAGYSLSVLLCFACSNLTFHADSVFLPTLTSSALGLFTVVYNFASSSRYTWNAAAIVSTVLSSCATLAYAALLFWTHKRIASARTMRIDSRKVESPAPSAMTACTLTPTPSHSEQQWQAPSFYSNYIANMHPTSVRSTNSGLPLTEDELVNQQMAMLLAKADSGPSPDASQHTFRINLPEDRDSRPGTADGTTIHRLDTLDARLNSSAHPLSAPENVRELHTSFQSDRFEGLSAWERVARAHDRSGNARRAEGGGSGPAIGRARSREDRQAEIELGSFGR